MTAWNGVIDVDRHDARARRPMPKGKLKSFDALGIPFRLGLHASVGEVADPTVHTFAARGRFSKISEADALHPSADHISSRDSGQSQWVRMIACAF